MFREKPGVMILALVLLLLLVWGVGLNGSLFTSVATAAPESVGCVKGKNGIKQKGDGCSGTVKLGLAPGGTINVTTGHGLAINNTSGNTGLYARQGAGSGSDESDFNASGVMGDSADADGVLGVTNNGHGVYGFALGPGTGGVGVYAQSNAPNGYGLVAEHTGNSFAILARGDVTQDRDSGGSVKAMARFAGSETSPDRCFNSQQHDSLIHSGGCGITRSGSGGNYVVDFNFVVNDRFISVIPEDNNDEVVAPTISFNGLANDQVRVKTFTVVSGSSAFIDRAFLVIVY